MKKRLSIYLEGLFCYNVNGDDKMKKPLVLCILDGVGIREESYGNPLKEAKMPTLDYIVKNYPHGKLDASGTAVGLPEGQMGNSEVGHMNLGAGRIVYQPLELINKEIKNGQFFENKNILDVINHAKKHHSRLHVMGLLSDGGVHSSMSHLFAILDMCKTSGVKQVYLHLFTDGRDTNDHSAYGYVKQLEEKISEINLGVITTICGRYYAMDRDNNWDRIKLAYEAIVSGHGVRYKSPKEMIEDSYDKEVTDEFIKPAIFNYYPLEDNDGIIVFNYRPDRLRELFTAVTNSSFKEFETKKLKNIKLVTMMPVSNTVICTNAYGLQNLTNTFGEYVSSKGLKQLRIAETEKYAHVTYFFDGGEEKKLNNTERILINSPKVATYDLMPQMSAKEVTDTLLEELDKDYYDVVILNYANGDMVGHTGNYKAAVAALEYLDACLKRLYDKITQKQGTLIITADHGNIEAMLDEQKRIITSHSTDKVPFIITRHDLKVKDGKLADVAPTMLKLLGLSIPKEMTGEVIVWFDNAS